MTNNRTLKDEQRFASGNEHRVTPGREAGVVNLGFVLDF